MNPFLREAGWTQATIAGQSIRAVIRRPARSLLTAVGVALGIAVFVATVGLAATLDAEVNATFDSFRATRLVVQDARNLAPDPLFDVNAVDRQVASLDAVIAGGLLTRLGQVQASGTKSGPEAIVDLAVATPGALQASLATLARGRFYDTAVSAAADLPVAVIGADAADRLGVGALVPGSVVFIGDVPILVAGILESFGSEPQLGTAITVEPAGLDRLGMPLPPSLTGLVRTELGAARAVAQSLPLVLRPQDPGAVGVLLPPEPTRLRDGVQGSLDSLALGVAGLSLLIGGIGIMNAMITAVSQRTGEIGLRRALGARPGHIVEHILIEGSLIGLLGAVVGLATGLVGLLGVTFYNGWQAVLPDWVWLVPPAAGALIGALAGIQPAAHAARLSPAAALRG